MGMFKVKEGYFIFQRRRGGGGALKYIISSQKYFHSPAGPGKNLIKIGVWQEKGTDPVRPPR